MHLAMYDAANSVTPIGRPYLAKQPVLGTASLNAALCTAAYTVLRTLYPAITSFQGNHTWALSQDASTVTQAEKDRGSAIGKAAADTLLSARANDGALAPAAYTPDGVPGAWAATGPESAATPQWGSLKPFGMSTSSQFRPPLPGGFATYPELLRSAQYAEQVDEVRRFGGHSDTQRTTILRTAEQTEIATFWANDLDSTYKPPSQLFQHTRIIARKKVLTPVQNTRLLALVAMALADAAITAWDAKYHTPIDLWRPVSAINHADLDGNDATTADADWRPLSSRNDGSSFTPPFPAYVSGHATFAGAWAAVLRTYFATDDIAFSATTNDSYNGGIYRRFNTLSAAAEENALSRLFLGVHYRWDGEQGLAAGEAVGRHVSNTYL